MAEKNNFGDYYTPKKFRNRGHEEPTQINRFNYTGGCWNKVIPYNFTCAIDPDTGATAHPKNADGKVRTNTCYSGYLYYIPYRLTNNKPGKCFDIDFAYYAGPGYYDGLIINMWIDVAFYNESTKQWTGYHHLSGPHLVAKVNQGADFLYGSSRGNYRPRCGLACSPSLIDSYVTLPSGGGTPTRKDTGESLTTYGSFKSYLNDCGIATPEWDAMYYFVGYPSHAVHYLSSNGYWSNGEVTITSAASSVSGNWVRGNPSARTVDKLDGGDNLSTGPLRINITEDFIKQCCGSTAAISKFKLRIWRGQESRSIYWDWPGNELPQWQALDNPQVGLLDYSEPTRHIGDWPPRYDAKAWYRNKTANIHQPELMVMYNYPGGTEATWTIN